MEELYKKTKDTDKGVEYIKHNLMVPVIGVFTHGSQRFKLEGHFSVTEMRQSYKFGQELQLQVWSTGQAIEEHRPGSSEYNRIEIMLPKESRPFFLKLLEELTRGADKPEEQRRL
jgi:hypothetical protein